MKESIQYHNFSQEEGEICMKLARDALRKYTKEGQRLDVGSVDDILNKRGGVLIQIESSLGFGQLRGTGAIYDGRRISDAIIDAVIHAASERSIGSEIHRSELNDLIIQMSIIEKVTITKNPRNILNIGEDCLIIPEKLGIWMYPKKAKKHNWSVDEYVNRTYKSSQLEQSKWDDRQVAVVKTSSFIEQNPNGVTLIDDE